MTLSLGAALQNRVALGAGDLNRAFLGDAQVYGASAAPPAYPGAQVARWTHTGGQLVTETPAAVDFDQEDRNDGGIYTRNGARVVLPAGRHLVSYQVAWINSDAGNRGTVETYLTLNGGLVPGSCGGGYQRNTSNDAAWARGFAIVTSDGSAELGVECFRDSNSSIGPFAASRSKLTVIKVDEGPAFAHYLCGSADAVLGATTYQQVDLAQTLEETIPAVIGRSANDVVLAPNKSFMIVGGLHFDGNNTRTTRFSALFLDGALIGGSTGYAYARDSNNEYASPNSFAIVETGPSGGTLSLHARGPGPGGTPVAANLNLNAARSGLFVMELRDGARWAHYIDDVGGQDGGASSMNVNVFRTAQRADATLLTGAGPSSLQVEQSTDLLVAGSIPLRRTASSGTRLTREAAFRLNGADVIDSYHGSYNRGDQGSTDTYDNASTPRGVATATAGQSLTLYHGEDANSGWNDGGGSPLTWAAEPAGAFVVDLATI